MAVHFKKYHGLGNDYLVIDPNVQDFEMTRANIRLICDRNFGVGSDGILYGPCNPAPVGPESIPPGRGATPPSSLDTRRDGRSRTMPGWRILEKYADVLVNFAINAEKGIRKDDVVLIQIEEPA